MFKPTSFIAPFTDLVQVSVLFRIDINIDVVSARQVFGLKNHGFLLLSLECLYTASVVLV